MNRRFNTLRNCAGMVGVVALLASTNALAAVRSVQDFVASPEAAEAKIKSCRAMRDAKADLECQNASEAAGILFTQGGKGRKHVRTIQEIQAERAAAAERK